jgi:peptidoglycan/LPS O-acetylase OafA/YrhL
MTTAVAAKPSPLLHLPRFERGPGAMPGLDGLRAISILCVVFAHLLWMPAFPLRAVSRIMNPADLGVRTFFVISGFLITTLLLKEKARSGTISLRNFYFRRTLRIVPAYYVFLLCIFFLSLLRVVQLEQADYWYTLTYTFNLKGLQHTWWVGHTWSLALEEQFYLLWPLVVRSCSRRNLAIVAGAFALLAPVARALLYLANQEAYWRWYEVLPLMADPIAIGCLLALCMSHADWQSKIAAALRGYWFWFAPALILCLEALNNRPKFFPHPVIFLSILLPVINLGIVAVVARAVLVTQGGFSRILNSRPMVAVGILSYSLYLWNNLFIAPGKRPLWLDFPFNLIPLAVFTSVSFLCVEKPLNELRRRFGIGGKANTISTCPST